MALVHLLHLHFRVHLVLPLLHFNQAKGASPTARCLVPHLKCYVVHNLVGFAKIFPLVHIYVLCLRIFPATSLDSPLSPIQSIQTPLEHFHPLPIDVFLHLGHNNNGISVVCYRFSCLGCDSCSSLLEKRKGQLFRTAVCQSNPTFKSKCTPSTPNIHTEPIL